MLQSHRNVNGHRAIGKASNKPSDQRPLPDFADDTLHRPDGIPLFGHESSMNIFQSHFLNASTWCPCFLSRNYDKESVWKSISNHLLPFPPFHCLLQWCFGLLKQLHGLPVLASLPQDVTEVVRTAEGARVLAPKRLKKPLRRVDGVFSSKEGGKLVL